MIIRNHDTKDNERSGKVYCEVVRKGPINRMIYFYIDILIKFYDNS